MAITLSPADLPACPGGTLGGDFLRWLGATKSFTLNRGHLLLKPDSVALGLQLEAVE